MADNSITMLEMEELLSEFIPKLLSSVNEDPTGKANIKTSELLQDIKTTLLTILKNNQATVITSATIAGAIQQAQKNQPSSNSTKPSTGSGNGDKTILEEVDEVKKNNSTFAKGLSGASKALSVIKSSLKAFGVPLERLMEQLELNNRMYGSLVQTGMVFNGSASQMAKAVNDAGFTVQTFTKLISQSSIGIQSLGGKDFANLASSIQKTNSQLGDFGLGADAYYKAFSDYADYLRLTGNLDKLRNEDVGQSFHDLMSRTVALTSAFGVSIEEFMKVKNQLNTNQVSHALIVGASRRYGVSQEDMSNRISLMKNMGYTNESINSILRRANGVNDAYSAANMETVRASQSVLAARNDREAFNNLRRVNDIGFSRAQSDDDIMNPSAALSVENEPYFRDRFGADTMYRSLNGRGSQVRNYDDYQRMINSNDRAAQAYQGLPYAREFGRSQIQSLDNQVIVSFNKTIGESIDVIRKMYMDEYPKLARAINSITEGLGKRYDNSLASIIHDNNSTLAKVLGPLSFLRNMENTILGGLVGAGVATGGYLLASRRRNIYHKERQEVPSNLQKAANDNTILEDSPKPGNRGTSLLERGKRLLRNPLKGARLPRLGGALGLLSVGLEGLDLYRDLSDISQKKQTHEITDNDASREKWESWGEHIGGAAGGIGGAALGSGIMSVPLSIAGYYGGKYLGKAIGYGGYEASNWFNGKSDQVTPDQTKDNNTQDQDNQNIQPPIQNNTSPTEIAELKQINQQMAQLVNLNRTLTRAIQNISPYTTG